MNKAAVIVSLWHIFTFALLRLSHPPNKISDWLSNSPCHIPNFLCFFVLDYVNARKRESQFWNHQLSQLIRAWCCLSSLRSNLKNLLWKLNSLKLKCEQSITPLFRLKILYVSFPFVHLMLIPKHLNSSHINCFISQFSFNGFFLFITRGEEANTAWKKKVNCCVRYILFIHTTHVMWNYSPYHVYESSFHDLVRRSLSIENWMEN